MPVYVDDMYKTSLGSYGRMKMSHMIATSEEELHAMALKIGVDRRHWQAPQNHSISHYDICASKRALAVSNGAIEITMRQAAKMSMFNKKNGRMPFSVEEAETWWDHLKGVKN